VPSQAHAGSEILHEMLVRVTDLAEHLLEHD
jgi:hypothetical protein